MQLLFCLLVKFSVQKWYSDIPVKILKVVVYEMYYAPLKLVYTKKTVNIPASCHADVTPRTRLGSL